MTVGFVVRFVVRLEVAGPFSAHRDIAAFDIIGRLTQAKATRCLLLARDAVISVVAIRNKEGWIHILA